MRNSVNLKELRQRRVAKQLSNPTASVERCLSSVLYMRYDKHMLSADVGWQWDQLILDFACFCKWETPIKLSLICIACFSCLCSTPVLVLRVRARLWLLPVPVWRNSAVLHSSSVTVEEPATITPTPTASGSLPLKTVKCLRKAELTRRHWLSWLFKKIQITQQLWKMLFFADL